jgi:hypothetical protein
MWNTAFIEGLGRSRRLWLLLPLYLWGLLLGLVQTWPLGRAALDGGLRNPFVDRLVTGGTDALGDLFISNPAAGEPAGYWLLLTVPLTLLFALGYNFCSGGMLSASVASRPFWAGCLRMFWSFTALGLLLVTLALLVSVGVAVLGGLLGLGATGTTVVVLTLLQLLNLLGEYARAIGVARDRRNPFVLLGAALSFCARNLGGVLAMGVLGLLLHIAVAALYLALSEAAGGSILAVAAQQLCVLLWLWVKFLRLLWALCYVRVRDGRVRPLYTEPGYLPIDPMTG